VADGAISYYIDHYVSVRVARFSYGMNCSLAYDNTNPEHLHRADAVFIALSGEMRILGWFDEILSKVFLRYNPDIDFLIVSRELKCRKVRSFVVSTAANSGPATVFVDPASSHATGAFLGDQCGLTQNQVLRFSDM
jgi:hypothetical protein